MHSSMFFSAMAAVLVGYTLSETPDAAMESSSPEPETLRRQHRNHPPRAERKKHRHESHDERRRERKRSHRREERRDDAVERVRRWLD